MDQPHTPAPADRAIFGILLANGATLVVALLQDWSVLQLMWPFWMQSVIIGRYARRRMLTLQSFSTEGMKINGKSVAATPATLTTTANFFALHYGMFHVVYLFFLMSLTFSADGAGNIAVIDGSTGESSLVYMGRVHTLDFVAFGVLSICFLSAHRASHREHVQADLAHTHNLGTLMVVPYARIVPMHLTIIAAVAIGAGSLWLFTLLKVAADVTMHKVEHGMLQRAVVPGAPPHAKA